MNLPGQITLILRKSLLKIQTKGTSESGMGLEAAVYFQTHLQPIYSA